MEYVFSFGVDSTLDVPSSYIKAMASKALERARLKAPIKTGKLRRSIKYKQFDTEIVLYIDKAMFGSVPYYQYVNEAPKKDNSPRSGNGYWINVIQEFGNVFYANVDKKLKEQLIKKSQEVKKAETKLEQARLETELIELKHSINTTKQNRKSANEARAKVLEAFAFAALFKYLEVDYVA